MSKELERLKEIIKVMEVNMIKQQMNHLVNSRSRIQHLKNSECEISAAKGTIGEFLDLAEKFL